MRPISLALNMTCVYSESSSCSNESISARSVETRVGLTTSKIRHLSGSLAGVSGRVRKALQYCV